jgi:hypothetical protein
MSLRGRGSCSLLGGAAMLVLGCGETTLNPAEPESLVCPELSGSADLLEIPYSDDPAANGRIRAFVAATRGLADLVLDMEQTAVSACSRMSRDTGLGEAPAGASVDQACDPIRKALGALATSGVELRISFVAPSCSSDTRREARCTAVCAGASQDCAALCAMQGALYAACTLPAVSVAASSDLPEIVRMARTLEENLPTLLYAEIALGRRLAEQAQALAAVATRLPADVAHAGPRGIACATLAAGTVGKAASRLTAVVGASETTVALLDPEAHPSAKKVP